MDDATFAAIKRTLATLLDLDLDGYKQPQLRRRVEAFAERHGGASGSAGFVALLGRDPQLLQATRDMLTINVTDFFRDPDQWERLRTVVLPALLRESAALRVWSAGCSYGQEPLSLAMLLDEVKALPRAEILGTDFDRVALARARAGGPYAVEELRGLPAGNIGRYFTQRPDGYWSDARLRQRTAYRELNLLKDRFETGFDLVVCRNVTIYFEADVKSRLLRRFREALRPGGVLFIGATEALLGADAEGFERLGGNFYARPREDAHGRSAA